MLALQYYNGFQSYHKKSTLFKKIIMLQLNNLYWTIYWTLINGALKKFENIYLCNFIKPFYKGDELVHNIHIQYSVYVNKVLNRNFLIKNFLEDSSHF